MGKIAQEKVPNLNESCARALQTRPDNTPVAWHRKAQTDLDS